MPVGKTSAPPRQIIVLIVATVLGIAAMAFLFLRTADLAQRGEIQLSLGDEVFGAGNVDRLSDDIGKFGPLLFADQGGGDRDIYLQHVGDTERDGWFAIGLRPLDAPRNCSIAWSDEAELFNYNCGEETYPADGEGLPSYPVNIDADGEITIDLNAAERETTQQEE